ncbi:MAG: cytochrome d ubiquinol oxidase subunit II [Candidatus Micrarchaeaceae archaeon]
MNVLYAVNYFVFSVFLAMFMAEIGFAVITLMYYKQYMDKIKRFINPIWEVTGTFAVFYVVNYEVTYPTILSIVGTAYAVPLLIAAIFIILRNIFIAFSEYIGSERHERNFRYIYSLSTLIAAILAVAVLTSGISGTGITIGNNSIGLSFILNPFNILMFISLALFSLYIATSLLKPARLYGLGIASLAIGFALGFVASYAYLPGFGASMGMNAPVVAAALVLIAVTVILQLRKTRYSGIFGIISIIILINLFGLYRYPYVFGRSNLTAYMASQALAVPALIITAVGGAIVALSLIALVYLSYLKSPPSKYP